MSGSGDCSSGTCSASKGSTPPQLPPLDPTAGTALVRMLRGMAAELRRWRPQVYPQVWDSGLGELLVLCEEVLHPGRGERELHKAVGVSMWLLD